MDILLWVIFGAVVGYVASLLVGTREGVLGNIIVGIVGAFLGGFIMNAFGQSGVSGFNWYSFFVSIFGAIVLLWIYRMFSNRRV